MRKSQQRAVLYSGKILPVTGQNVGIHNDVKFLFTPKSHPNHETPPWFYGEWYTKVSERHKRRGEERISDAHSSDPITLQTKDLLLRKGKRPAQGHPAGESQSWELGIPVLAGFLCQHTGIRGPNVHSNAQGCGLSHSSWVRHHVTSGRSPKPFESRFLHQSKKPS